MYKPGLTDFMVSFLLMSVLFMFFVSIHELSSELALVSNIMSLPILEPLTAGRIDKVCLLALGCIDVALTVGTGSFTLTGSSGKACCFLLKVTLDIQLQYTYMYMYMYSEISIANCTSVALQYVSEEVALKIDIIKSKKSMANLLRNL